MDDFKKADSLINDKKPVVFEEKKEPIKINDDKKATNNEIKNNVNLNLDDDNDDDDDFFDDFFDS